jgi:hypothetical protein
MKIQKSIILTTLVSTLLATGNSSAADRDRNTIRLERPVIENLRPVRLNRCALMPDLVITRLNVTWNNSDHQARLTVKNIGKRTAGAFMLYVTPDENPTSNNHRPQRRYDINGLRPGEARSINADFDALAHPDNNNLNNVYRVVAHADPKNQVKECNENNNTRTTYVLRRLP